jgi:outer membrane lipoprotein-sorting protein
MSFAVISRRALLVGAAALSLLPGAAFSLTAEEQAELTALSQSLQSIQTMNGEFSQFDPNGSQHEGQFFIARPGRVRFQYDPPATVSVIADGESVLVYDKAMQTYDIWPLSQTPLRLLLDSNLSLATSEKVTRVSVASDLIEVELHDETRFSNGVLNLVFDRATHELRQWTVTDQQGLQTLVVLYNVEVGNQLAADLFEIDYMAATNAARDAQSN